MTTSLATRMYVLRFGAELVPKSLSVRGAEGASFWAPFLGVLVETTDGLVLFDTGMSRATHQDDAVEAVYRQDPVNTPELPWHLYPPPADPARSTWGRGGDPLAAALADVDVTVGDLSLAVISHLHWDHSGGIASLAAAGVPVAIHADELSHARSGSARFEEGFRAADWSVAGCRWQELRGDTELAPGVHALATPGHTPGHLSFSVDLPGTGSWIFAGDAADLGENLIDRIACGYSAGGRPEDERRADASLDKLLEAAHRPGARLIPGHDPVVTNAIAHPPGGHR